MRNLVIGLTAALFALPAAAQQSITAPDLSNASMLELAETAAADRSNELRTYVVYMKNDPGLSYDGGVDGYAATAPQAGERYNAQASHVQMYAAFLQRAHDAALADVDAVGSKIYSYSHTLNGFAARLTPAQAAKLEARKDVVNVIEDFAMEVETSDTSDFLGLNDRKGGLRRDRRLLGEDVVVGVLDTGAVPQHPSFSDLPQFELPAFCGHPPRWARKLCRKLTRIKNTPLYDAPPSTWMGTCQVGEGWTEDDCNNKLIGARWYNAGFLAAQPIVEGDPFSPADSSGHGTHTASTAAGNRVDAFLQDTNVGKISGMAPRARVAVYKVCWLAPGASTFSCFFSDSAAATDAAVADGVDVLNFSVGTAAAFNDPQDLAFLRASNAGVFVARSAGNGGPGFGTTNAGEPWVTTVAASTADGTLFTQAATINSPPSVAGDYSALEGAITGPLSELGPVTEDVVAAEPILACDPLTNDLSGKIALISRGACAFTDKVANAVNAGASAVLMYTDDRPKTVMGGTATPITQSVPGVMIDREPGEAILAELTGGNAVNATLSSTSLIAEPRIGDIMAGFSSRGPYLPVGDWVKPDITAPGVNILAGDSPNQADGSAGGLFGYLSGTSMSSPHIAGLAALVIQAQPHFSPAQVKSALMTTARQDVVKEDETTPADPFDYGAGHADPNKAVDPGLTYDAGILDYVAASCGTATPLEDPVVCDFIEDTLGLSTDPSDLNLPSIGIDGLPGTQTVTRTVTAVANAPRRWGKRGKKRNRATRYRAVVDAPEGFEVEVSPSTIRLRPGQTATYEVTITNVSAPPGQWFFGSLTWESKKGKGNDVYSPIAVNATAIIAPAEVSESGTSGTGSFDITFGYSGEYTALQHGLNDNALVASTVEDDPNNNFVFNGPGTVFAFLDELPEGTAFARWDLTNEYTTGTNDDIDLYLYYCPNFSCTQIDSSTNVDSNERVEVLLPASDPTIPDPYLVFAHGFNTDGGLPSDLVLFAYSFGIIDDAGNLDITSAPAMATIGTTETITFAWDNLNEGIGFSQLGAISHSDASGIQGLTVISVDNDFGTICDFPGFVCR